MKSSNPSLLFTISLILILNSPFLANANECKANLVIEICKNVKYKDFCFQVLQADSKIPGAKTKCELAKFTIELAIRKAQETQDFFKELMKKDNSPYLQKCASQNYGDVIRDFKYALSGLTDHEIAFIYYDISNTDDIVGDCENQMVSQGIQNANISSRNKETEMLVSLISDIIDQLDVKICPAN